jgi:hypothetical protein
MAQYGYSTQYTGQQVQTLPPGYLEAATAPGRNLAMGIAAMGQGLGKAIEQYRTKKAETEAATQSWETVSGLMQQQLSSDPKYLAIQQYMETGALPQGVTEQDIPRYTQQVQADREMLNKFSSLGEKFPDMSLAKKKAALGDAVMVLNQYRTDQQKQAETELRNLQTTAARFNLQTAQGAEARRLGLEQAISQVAQLPTTQDVTVPASPAIISSSLNIPAEQQPYTPFYQVQQVMGGQQQQPDVAAFAQGLGRPVTRIPQRIPIADQPLTAAPAPVPQPLVSTQRVPLRDRQALQQQQAARPVGIAPIPQREVPAFESQPIQRTATETQPVGYQDRFRQAVNVFQRLGAPINPDAIRSVLEATGTPRPIQVDTQTLPGGITVVRADGKVDILPAPKMVEGKDLTEGQSNSLGFASRMMLNEGTINDVVGRGYRPGGLTEFGFTPERLRSDDRKTYDAAKENWIAAALRKESGAAIGKDEYSAADRQYFPQPGDSDKVLKQKATLRSTVFKSMKAGIGRFADDYLRQMGVGQEGQTQGSVRKYNPVTKRIE